MNDHFSIAGTVSTDSLFGEKGEYAFYIRYLASFIAIVFPAIAILVLLSIYISLGFDGLISFLFSRKLVGASPVIAIPALLLWIWRYSIPAIKVFQIRPKAIFIEQGIISFGKEIVNVSELDKISIDKPFYKKDVSLILNDGTKKSLSLIFLQRKSL